MRSLLVYLLAIVALGVGAWFAFPDWFGRGDGDATLSSQPRSSIAPVVVAHVVRAPFAERLEALGTVIANESVDITPNRADHVTAIHFEDGQRVERDQVLFEMNTAEERAELAAAVANLEDAERNLKRATDLHAEELVSDSEFDAAKTAVAAAEARVEALKATIADREVRAPFDGVLGLRHISVGAYVQPATLVTTLDDLSVVKLDFTIPETWLPAVRSGMAILARSDAWPNDEFRGRVETLDTRLDPSTRSVVVRAEMPNPDTKLRPGMLLKVAVDRGEEPVLQIPEAAVVPVGSEQFVWSIGEGDVAHRVEVELGRRRPGRVEVRGGLEQGQRVVVEGIVRVRDGEAVAVVATREVEGD
ncbi:MAG: efflux RND transporter periplasmic adaptor subunit [Planctomycetes bacterium]|nr:efflux RND transporter periplasmic adaptor subunit [Planctomycetota bacterium]